MFLALQASMTSSREKYLSLERKGSPGRWKGASVVMAKTWCTIQHQKRASSLFSCGVAAARSCAFERLFEEGKRRPGRADHIHSLKLAGVHTLCVLPAEGTTSREGAADPDVPHLPTENRGNAAARPGFGVELLYLCACICTP